MMKMSSKVPYKSGDDSTKPGLDGGRDAGSSIFFEICFYAGMDPVREGTPGSYSWKLSVTHEKELDKKTNQF